MAFTSPPIHHWQAGDEMNAVRMNEIVDSINWLRDPPLVDVQRLTSGNQSLPASTWTTITFDTENVDSYGMYDPTAPTLVTVTVPGWYAVEIVMCMSNTANNARVSMGAWKQSSELILRWDQQGLQNISGNINMRKEGTMFLNTGDTLQLRAFASDARNIVVNNASESPRMRMRWVSN